jgi:hypothetical protein
MVLTNAAFSVETSPYGLHRGSGESCVGKNTMGSPVESGESCVVNHKNPNACAHIYIYIYIYINI